MFAAEEERLARAKYDACFMIVPLRKLGLILFANFVTQRLFGDRCTNRALCALSRSGGTADAEIRDSH